jgi:beta-lactamase regulating signal transducer with metallopeptidase domain
MTNFLLQMGLSNACFALVLALVAMAAGAKARCPHLAHMLWLLVFVKLVTPPLVTIPVGVFPPQPDHAGAGVLGGEGQSVIAETIPGAAPLSSMVSLWNRTEPCLATLWLLGSVVVLVWSMARVCRFGRLLAAESDVPPPELQEEAEKMARRLGLATTPTICTTSAHLSPMVWWTGGLVRIVIPRALLDRMDAQDWRWILAHELAHVRRHDYLVRWVEWLAYVCFWWNPVVWWAQRNLRAVEEICCDDLVISTLHPRPRSYADSLLSAVEFLARPAVRAPAMASEVNSGGSLERRFRMIVSGKSNQTSSRWLRMCVLACALAVLPLGMVSAQNYDAVAKRLKESVKQGEITPQQADAMLAALKKEPGKKGQDTDKTTAHPTKVKKDLGAGVEAGKVSKEGPVKKHAVAAKDLKEKTAAKSQSSTDLETAWKNLQARVQAGKLTKEQALAKMAALKEGAAKKNETVKKDLPKKPAAKGQGPVDLDAAWKKLQTKVQAGELTKEQAQAQMAALKKEPIQKNQGSNKAATSPTKVKKDIGAAAEAGKISKEDTAMKDKTAPKTVKEKKAVQKGQDADKTMAPPMKVKKYPGAAVETGKISKENAPKKNIKKTPVAQPDYDGISRDLKAAVQAGKLTKEEAKAKWEAIKKQAAADKKDK